MALAASETVRLHAPGATLEGVLAVPAGARGIVIMGLRNEIIAQRLRRMSLATLSLELLTPAEDAEYEMLFNIPLLSHRLLAAVDWVEEQQWLRELPLGLLAAGSGAAAALWAAAELGTRPSAIVSLHGRPDLAFGRLRAVTAPTLLVVSETEQELRELNRRALGRLGRGQLVSALDSPEEAAGLASDWFERYLIHGRDVRFAA